MDKLNNIAKRGYPPRKRVKDLERNRRYSVVGLEQLVTKFGPQVVIKVEDISQGEFDIFLPHKVAEALIADDNLFHEMCIKANKLSLFIVNYGDAKFEFID